MSKVVLHDYWGEGTVSVSYLELNPVLTQFLQDRGIVDDNQFVLIQHIETSPGDTIDFDFNIHYYIVTDEE